MAERKKRAIRGARPPSRGAKPPGRGAKPPSRGAKPPSRGAKPPSRGAKPPSRGAKPPGRGSKPSGPGGPRGAGTRREGPKPTPRSKTGARAVRVTAIEGAAFESDGKVRINRFLASAGVCSRRAADELVQEGRVTVNGQIVTELGVRVDPVRDDVRVDDRRVQPEPPVYLLFNKPKDVVCTNAANETRRRVVDFLPDVRGRIYTVGRLDADSEGLILLTNDGDFAQRVAHPSFGLAKTYAVLLRGRIDDETAQKARGGVWLAEGRTTGARVVIERRGRDRTYLKMSIREGRNREIRRVFAKLGYPVISLKRVRIGQLSLHGLGTGRYRFLQRAEVDALLSLTHGEGGEA